MRSMFKFAAPVLLGVIVSAGSTANPYGVTSGVGPTMQSIGPLTFGANGVLYAADPQVATIFAIELAAGTAAPGTAAIEGIDQKVAALLGTDAAEISMTDLVVDPRSKNTYLAVMRGQGAGAKPALLRIDGKGAIELVSLETSKFSSIALPNPADANPSARSNPRAQSVTDMALHGGKLFVAGLSNEEFSSKLWAIPYPFASADRGTSVEIFHGNHGRLETRSPVYTFVPYTVGNEPHLIAGYLCTPLVKFPIKSLAAGSKVVGTTIAELGAGNRPIDMVLYQKGGKEFLLMSNTSRGVMKIGTERFASETPITAPVPEGTAGVPYETISALAGVTQLDLLDAGHVVALRRPGAAAATGGRAPAPPAGPINLEVVILP
jgi:hypothetical protein